MVSRESVFADFDSLQQNVEAEIEKTRANADKGGKVLGSGTYGCIFRPPLLCEGQTERQKGYVTKLMLRKEAKAEYEEIQTFLQYIKSIANYQKYFIIDHLVNIYRIQPDILRCSLPS